METLFFYFAKVILCSGVMFLYYIIFLKDKTFHHYNRFYLLGTLLVSMLLPLVKVDYFTINLNQNFYEMMVLFQHNSNIKISTDDLSISTIILAAFALISLFLLIIFGKGLLKINRFKNQFPRENFEGISFFMTNLENAPFSYFRNLFWKDSILLQSDLGKQILKHEMVHIEQKHSYDKILIEILTAVIWFNPIFYLIRKEINLIHEYLADKKALKNTDTKAFAQMLLEAHFSGKVLPATSPFLNSNLKKRIIMLKKSNTKFSYWRKVLALPLLFMLVFAYMVKAENREIAKTNEMAKEMSNKYFQNSKLDTLKPTKGLELVLKTNAKFKKESDIATKDVESTIQDEKEKFPNPMTINLYRSSDNNTFILSGKEVSKEDFIKYFIKYNENKNYYFGSTATTYKELETAGKLAMFTAGSNKDMQSDQEVLGPIFKKYKNLAVEKKQKSDVIQKISPAKNSEISNKTNFIKDRDYEKVPLTNAEKAKLKKDAEGLEKIRLKYEQKDDNYLNGFQFAFKSQKLNEIIYDANGSVISEDTKQNERLLEFPNTVKDSEFFIDGKKVSKETLMKYTSNLYKVNDFFKEKSQIKILTQEKVTDGKNTYLMKLEILTK